MRSDNSIDLYAVLDVNQAAEDDILLKAYKKLALSYHPEKTILPVSEAKRRFREVSQAYRVLRDEHLRNIYNREGIGALRLRGILPPPKPEELWKEVTGTRYPFSEIFTQQQEQLKEDQPKEQVQNKACDTLEEVWCTLEELLGGCTKWVEVTKKRGSTEERRKIRVDIGPGWAEGTRLRFRGDGDAATGEQPGDRVMLVMQTPHPRFVRRRADLYIRVTISLLAALTGTVISVETLDGRTLRVPISDVVHPGYEKIVPGEGMPRTERKGKGDLIIGFDIEFPTEVTEGQRKELQHIFSVGRK